ERSARVPRDNIWIQRNEFGLDHMDLSPNQSKEKAMLRIVLRAAAVAIVYTGALAQMTPFCRPGIDSGVTCPCNNPPVGGGLGCNKFGSGPIPSSILTAVGSPIVGPGDSL